MVELTLISERKLTNLGFKVNQDQGVLIVDVASNSQHVLVCAGDIITEIKGVFKH